MDTRTEYLLIQGMSCATCVRTITTSLEGLDGVSGVTVNFAADEATVRYDPELVSLAETYDAVTDAGYQAVRESVTVGITDMSCATCAKTNQTREPLRTSLASSRLT